MALELAASAVQQIFSKFSPVVDQGHLVGRVEHVVSGQATTFQSLETLLAFIAQVLHAERARSSTPPE
jgi:hypothetical protein